MMKFQFASTSHQPKGVLVLFVEEKKQLFPMGKQLDAALGGALSHAMAQQPRFNGGLNETLVLNGIGGKDIKLILLCGVGKLKDINAQVAENLGSALAKQLDKAGFKDATLYLHEVEKAVKAELASSLALGAALGLYRFDKYRTNLKDHQKPALASLCMVSANEKTSAKKWQELKGLAESICFTRDLVTEPPNAIYPETFIKQVKAAIKGLPLTVKILDEKQMAKLGMGALLAVNQASDREPYTLILEYNGLKNNKKDFPLALIGKGVTFDTGGLCLKPGQGTFPMSDMKTDMGGAAAVVGAMKAIAMRGAKANVVGLVGLVENVISDEAYIPSDVIKSMSGQTIEILNTDAEGRLVMADVMWYAQEKYNPKMMIDIATLTGSIVMALGPAYAGLFCEDEKLTKQIFTSGQESGDKVWHMPLDASKEQHIASMIADMANMATSGGTPGSSIAAVFLKRFVQKGVTWAHIDIASTAWSRSVGATGFGVRLLDQLVRNMFEKKNKL